MPAGGTAAIKNEVMLYGPVGITVKLLGFLMIDRGNSPKARRTMERAAERMRRERLTVFISPEGTRSPVGEVLPFKKGAFHLALDSGAPIVPVLFDGAFDLHPPGRFTTTPGLVRIRILPPRPTRFTAADVATEAEAVRQMYITELARFRAEAHRAPGPPLTHALTLTRTFAFRTRAPYPCCALRGPCGSGLPLHRSCASLSGLTSASKRTRRPPFLPHREVLGLAWEQRAEANTGNHQVEIMRFDEAGEYVVAGEAFYGAPF